MSTPAGRPTEAQHRDQYRRNAALSLQLEAQGTLDWTVTTMFYAVLHLVDVYLARSGHSPTSHRARHDRLSGDPNWSPILQLYYDLEDRSLDARYRCYTFTPAEVRRIRTTRYEPLERQLRAWLGL